MNAAANKLIVKIVEGEGLPSKVVIALHGWTGDETSFTPLVKNINSKNIKWILPRAPYKSDTGKGFTWFSGSEEKGWKVEKTWSGLNQLLHSLFEEGITPKDIFMIGFSQGAALAMEYATRLEYSIGGIIPVAGFIKNRTQLKNDAPNGSLDMRILLMHGVKDEIIRPEASEKAYQFYKNRGNQVSLELYDAGHKIPLISSGLISKFLGEKP